MRELGLPIEEESLLSGGTTFATLTKFSEMTGNDEILPFSDQKLSSL